MALKEFPILNKNHKMIILASMALGVLYPFFTDFEVPIINNPKYLSIGALLLGMVLFWEFYGSRKYDTNFQEFNAAALKQRPQQQYPTQPAYSQSYPQTSQLPYPPPHQSQQLVPQQQYPHPPSYDDQMFIEANYQQSVSRPVNPLYKPKSRVNYERPTEEYAEVKEESYEGQQLPRVSDVIKHKVKLPSRIPPPKEIPLTKSSSKSEFKKFGF